MTAQVKLQENNVDEVLKAMTLEEKAMLVIGGNRQITSTASNGMVGGHAQRVPGAAGTTQAIPRLGIPSTVLTDGPAGVNVVEASGNDDDQFRELMSVHRHEVVAWGGQHLADDARNRLVLEMNRVLQLLKMPDSHAENYSIDEASEGNSRSGESS